MTRIACQQLAPVIGDLAASRALALTAIREAVDRGADVVVLPELTTSGYMFDSPQEAAAVAIGQGHEILVEWATEAARADIVLAFEHPEQIAGGRELEKAFSRHTVVAEAACIVGPDLAVATRLIATDLFHAFGSPEVRQIAADGTLRASYLGGNGELRAWAAQHGIAVSDETVPGE